jgi:hypothetical protein
MITFYVVLCSALYHTRMMCNLYTVCELICFFPRSLVRVRMKNLINRLKRLPKVGD